MSIDSYEAVIATVSDTDAAKALTELEVNLASTKNLNALIDTYLSAGAAALRELGVETIWYDKHKDLPDLIKGIREGQKGTT